MAKILSMDLRTRVVAAVQSGSSRRAAAARFGISASCAVKLLGLVRATGSAVPGRRGRRPGSGKLQQFRAALIGWVEAKPDITMPELAERLKLVHGATASPSSLSRLLCQAGWTYKKSPRGAEGRTRWILPWLCLRLDRLVFLDETGVTTRHWRLIASFASRRLSPTRFAGSHAALGGMKWVGGTTAELGACPRIR